MRRSSRGPEAGLLSSSFSRKLVFSESCGEFQQGADLTLQLHLQQHRQDAVDVGVVDAGCRWLDAWELAEEAQIGKATRKSACLSASAAQPCAVPV